MTIIVSYQKNNHIYLVGDLLLSGVELDVPLRLPTRFHLKQPVTPRYLSGLCSKLVSVDDNLAVAWAGSMSAAQHLVRRIANELSAPYSSDEILGLIYDSGLSERELNSVSFIFYGAYRDQETGDIRQFVQDYCTGQTVIDPKQKVKYAGSGQVNFLECMDFRVKGSIGQVTEYEESIGWLMARMALALYKEIISEETHRLKYGGGFEIACLDPSARIAKIPATFVFWKFDGLSLELVGPILSFEYPHRNTLLISRLTRSHGSPKWEITQFIVNDLLADTAVDLTGWEPSFDTFFVVHYLLPDTSGESVRILIKKGLKKSVRVSFSSESGMVRVDVEDEFLREVELATKRHS